MDAVSVSAVYDAQRAQQMEEELATIRQAFEDYVVTTQDLESGMDQEIHDMQGKLDASTRANATLASQLKKMDPMLKKLELSLDGTKKRLKEESRRRRQAEARCEELEALRVGNATLREAYEIPNLRMGEPAISMARSGEVQLRNVATDVTEAASNRSKCYKRDGPVSDEAYSEVVEELKTVTEQLITTQQKLWKTEDQFRDQRPPTSGSESVELEVVRAELAAARRDLAAVDTDKARSKSHIMDQVKQQEMELDEYVERNRLLEERVHQMEKSVQESEQEVARCEALLDESREENARLVEEISCLRDVLPFSDHFDVSFADVGNPLANVGNRKIELREKIEGEVRAKILKEANKIREQEINALRDQFKKAFKDNALLREKIEKLQSGNPSSNLGIEEHRLKREIERVNDELRAAQEKHKVALLEMESSWKMKVEQMMTGEFIPEDLLEEMEDEMRTAIDAAAVKVSTMKKEKEALTERVDELQRELKVSQSKIQNLSERGREHEAHQKSSREEILRLEKSNTHLTSELEYTTRIMTRMDAECERLTREHAQMKTELEVAVQVIESSSMDDRLFASHDTIKLKEQCHALTTKLNKLNDDYFSLQGELETARQNHLDIQEEAILKNASEVQFLTKRIVELEEMQERSRLEQNDMSKKLQMALEEHENEVKELVIAERKSYSLELIETLEMELLDERECTKSLQMELKQCKDALSSSRIENKRLEEEILEKAVPSDPVLLHERSAATDEPFHSFNHPPIQSKQNDPSCDRMEPLKAKLAVKTQELEVSEQRLLEARTELLKTEYKRSHFVEENNILKTEIAAMKHSVEKSLDNSVVKGQGMDDVIAIMAPENEGTLDELKRKHKELAEEKISLQHEVDDSKIALSVSHYSQERCKEELRVCQARLESAMDDVYALKDELEKMTSAFEELKMDHDDLLEHKVGPAVERKMKKEVLDLSKQLQAIKEVNASLQQEKEEVTSKQSRIQLELLSKEDEIKSLRSSLVSKQEETRLLNEETSNLSATYENAKKEIDFLTNELEASNDRLKKTQIEAEKNGRDIAEAEALELLEAEKESGREIREQLEKAMTDYVSLKAAVDAAESALRETKRSELLVERSVDVLDSLEQVKDGDLLEFEGEFDHFIESDDAILEQVESDAENELRLSNNVEERNETKIRVVDEVEALVSELLVPESSTMAMDRPPANPVEALKKEISRMIEDKADLMKQVEKVLSSSSSNSSDTLEKALGGPPTKRGEDPTTQSDLEATNNVLKRIDDILTPFDSDDVHHELQSRIEKQKRLVSTAQKAEVIRRKVSFLAYSLCRSRKEHSDVLLELTAAKNNINALLDKLEEKERDEAEVVKLRKEKNKVLQRLQATELRLSAAMDSEKEKSIDAQAKFSESQKQCEESQVLAAYYKAQLDKLEERNQQANIDKASLEEELKVLKRRVNNLIHEAEQRAKSASTPKKDDKTPSILAQDSQELLALTQRYFHENVELQDRLQETEKTLAAARNIKRQLDGKLLSQDAEPLEQFAASAPKDSASALGHHVASMPPATFAPENEAGEDGLKQAPHKELADDTNRNIFGSMEARTDEHYQERE